jgi:hypothetical protein
MSGAKWQLSTNFGTAVAQARKFAAQRHFVIRSTRHSSAEKRHWSAITCRTMTALYTWANLMRAQATRAKQVGQYRNKDVE